MDNWGSGAEKYPLKEDAVGDGEVDIDDPAINIEEKERKSNRVAFLYIRWSLSLMMFVRCTTTGYVHFRRPLYFYN